MSTSIESKSEQVGSAQSLPEQEYACLPFSVTLPPEKKKKKKKKPFLVACVMPHHS